MVSMEPQVSFVLFLLALNVSLPCILNILTQHLFFFRFFEFQVKPLLEIVVIGPKVEIVFEFFDFGGIINVFFAFGGNIRSNDLDFNPLKILEVEVTILLMG